MALRLSSHQSSGAPLHQRAPMALDKGPLLGLLGVFCWVLKPVLRPQRKWTPASFRLWGPTTTKWGHPVRRPSPPPRGCVLEYCCFVELPSVTTIISSPFISLGRNEMFCKLRSLLTGRSSLVVLHFHPFFNKSPLQQCPKSQ